MAIAMLGGAAIGVVALALAAPLPPATEEGGEGTACFLSLELLFLRVAPKAGGELRYAGHDSRHIGRSHAQDRGVWELGAYPTVNRSNP
jgi:hypothetical protein